MSVTEREVLSQLLSGKKDTRLVLRRNAAGLERGSLVRSAGDAWRVQGFISRSGDAILERCHTATCEEKSPGAV